MMQILFRSDGKGWPLIEGKNFIHQFIYGFSKPAYTILKKDVLEKTKNKSKHMQTSTKKITIHIV